MVAVPLQTLEELDLTAEEFERLVDQGLELSILRVMESEDIEEALAQADQSALDLIITAWAAYVAEELIPRLDTSMIEAGAETLARLALAVGNPLTLLQDQALDTEQYLQQAQNRLVGIGNELWFNVRTQLAEGIALGESQPQLAQRVRDAIVVTKPRANVIARTESHGARNVAAMATLLRFETAYRIKPGVMRKQWQATNDPRTRHTHVDADGQIVQFSAPFIVGESSLAFPGDPSGPPGEIINCRCTTFAVFNPEDLDLNDNGTIVTINAAGYAEEPAMPWNIVPDHPDCASGQFAVVKEADGEVEGCHDTEESAKAQLAALYASEEGLSHNPRYVRVSGPIVVGNRVTGDGRQFNTDNLSWQIEGATPATLEIPLGYQYERSHGGSGSDKVARVGRIDTIERDGNQLFATGVIDLQAPWGPEAARLMGTRANPGILAGVSILIDQDPDGAGLTVEYQFAEGCDIENEAAEFDPVCAEPERTIITDGARIRGVDLVDIPAFAEARLYLDEELPDDIEEPEEDFALTAAAYTITIPELPPVEWFAEPGEDPAIGAITVTDEGRFFGYLAPRHVAHRSYRDKRVTVPVGNVDYGIWMNRATLVDDGHGGYTRLATGPITMDCGHAPVGPKGQARREHYDNACSVVATACVGENRRGVWIAGALVPGVNAEQVARMMACQLSGDWGPHREKPGKRELAAALLVPVPGFPTAHHSFTLQGGELASTTTALRFGTTAGVDEPIGMRAAADRIAAQIGRDPETRIRAFASELLT
jgi:hypothetical protein